jgi:nucleotide-binding universal stress UspA family protein
MTICNARIMISNVLLATDFSAESAQAVQWALRICALYKAKLYAAYVMDVFPFALRDDATAVARTEQIRQNANAKMKEFVCANHLDGNNFESALISGDPSTAIEDFVREHEIDLIVLGSSGDAGMSRLFEGSMAEEIFRSAQCPVIVVGPKAKVHADTATFGNLLFSSDLSRFSRTAIPYVEFLLETPSTKLTLAHFLEEERADVYERHQIRRRIERELREMIAPGFIHQLEDAVVESCAPSEGMLKMAEGAAANLLVLGVRSGGAFTRAATHGWCSIAPQVISEAPCPVLTVRAV